MADDVCVSRTAFSAWIVNILRRTGMFAAEAEIVAAHLLWADERNATAHGSRRLSEFFDALDLGDIDPRAQTLTLADEPAFAVIDGSTGMGHVAVSRATDVLVAKAKGAGVATVVVRNSRTAGTLAAYAAKAAAEGLLVWVAANPSLSRLASPSGTPIAGDDHVLCWGAPLSATEAVVVDPGMARIDWGDVCRAADAGAALPADAAFNDESQPTADPATAVRLRVADPAATSHLGTMAAAFAGLLSGGKPCVQKKRRGLGGICEYHLYAASIERFTETDVFQERLRTLVDQLPNETRPLTIFHDAVPAEEITIESAVVTHLGDLGARLKLPVPWSGTDGT